MTAIEAMTNETIITAYDKYTSPMLYNRRPMMMISNWHDLQQFANEIGAVEFRVYLFDTETAETSEDAVDQIFGVDKLINWMVSNSTECLPTLVYTVDMFDANGDMLTDFDIVC